MYSNKKWGLSIPFLPSCYLLLLFFARYVKGTLGSDFF